jgi:CheY-like chemotaxis protein
MDMQMPGLDGLGATRAIRNLGGDFEQLPIIGLSANTAPGQVNRCLEAGMTDHLAKPFSAVRLKDTIQRWAAGGSGKRNPMIDMLARHAGVNRVRALLDMLAREIETFETVDPGDRPELLRLTHALRGAAALLGFGDLAQACKVLEQTLRADADPSAELEDVLCLAARIKVAVASEPLRAH